MIALPRKRIVGEKPVMSVPGGVKMRDESYLSWLASVVCSISNISTAVKIGKFAHFSVV